MEEILDGNVDFFVCRRPVRYLCIKGWQVYFILWLVIIVSFFLIKGGVNRYSYGNLILILKSR